MHVLLFLSRPLVLLLWCKMWDLGFGSNEVQNPYGQMEDATPPTPPAPSPPAPAQGQGYKPYGVPDGNPSLGQGGGAYVPPPTGGNKVFGLSEVIE